MARSAARGATLAAVDPRQAAVDAEADRLLGLYIRVRLLAQTRGLDILTAGAVAVREGMVAEADWRAIREAIEGKD